MKKILLSLAGIGLIALMAFKLYNNKEEMKINAKLAEVTSDAIPVEITQIENKRYEDKVEADGTFEAITDLSIISETQGKVIKVHRQKGDYVKKGELLAEIENELLQAQVSAAEANYLKLKTDLDRFTKLSEKDAVTKRQLEDVRIGLKNAEAQFKSARKNLENTYIRATASGIINDDFIQEGAFIGGGTRLYEIVDVKKLKLNIKLPAEDILKIKSGDTVKIRTTVYPTETFKGEVRAIAAKADAALKYNIEIQIANNAEKELKPGMYATAYFDFKGESPKNYLDRNALIGSLQNPQVYVVEDSVARLKKIQISAVHSNEVEVASGLSAQDKVVATGQINLSEGLKVKVLN